MIPVNIKKGYSLNVKGRPSLEVEALERPEKVAVLPEKIPYIKPRLTVEKNSDVKVGSQLFVDKRNPDLKFLSPGGGKIIQINYGPRRAIREIVIELDPNEAYEEFPVVSENDLQSIERNRLVSLLIDGGLWPFIREFPFRDIAVPNFSPPMIFVGLDAQEPFQTQPEVYLKGKTDQFRFGIAVLQKLALDKPVCVFTNKHNSFVINEMKELITHAVKGVYPADDPGVLLYHIKKKPIQNRSWFVTGQDVLMIAPLLQNGRYPTERTVVVAGSSANRRKHFNSHMGVPLSHISQHVNKNESVRYIVGGLFRGYTGFADSYMGLYETSLMLLPEGDQREYMALFNPGYHKPSYSRVYLSHFNRSDFVHDCNRHGEDRACIACMHCADVCPVDILPQMAYKAILAGEVEEYLEHGLLDCVECGLCSYVCPSKIELAEVFKTAKADYAKELF